MREIKDDLFVQVESGRIAGRLVVVGTCKKRVPIRRYLSLKFWEPF